MQDDPTDGDIKDPNDADDSNGAQSNTQPLSDAHEAPSTLEDDPQFEEPLASPAVLGEDGSAGSASDGETMDIDSELDKLGLKKDDFQNED